MEFNKERIIFLNKEEVTLEYAGEIAWKLYELDSLSTEPIILVINSNGGYCEPILVAIKALSSKLYTCGFCSVGNQAMQILFAGNEVSIFRNSEFFGITDIDLVNKLKEKYNELSIETLKREGLITNIFDTFYQFNTYWELKNKEYEKSIKNIN